MIPGPRAQNLLDHAAAWDHAISLAMAVFFKDMELTENVNISLVVMESIAKGYHAAAKELMEKQQ